jgi:hypothetical protein
MDEFDFAVLRFAVELRVRCAFDPATSTTSLDSRGFRLIGSGLEGVADGIDVRVSARLRPTPPDARICALQGSVEFVCTGDLPPVLRAVPEPALRAAAEAMSRTLINVATERFSKQVPQAYSEWAAVRV